MKQGEYKKGDESKSLRHLNLNIFIFYVKPFGAHAHIKLHAHHSFFPFFLFSFF